MYSILASVVILKLCSVKLVASGPAVKVLITLQNDLKKKL